MKKILIVLSFFVGLTKVNAQCGITFSVSANEIVGINSVLLALEGTEDHVGFSVGIDWGDGTPWSIGFENDWVHTYSGPGTYEICVNFVGVACVQEDFCESYTITDTPEHSELCPLAVTYTVSGSVLNVEASGSGATTPSLSFHPDILSFIDDPWDISGFEFIDGHSGDFDHNYGVADPDATYIFCVGYVDLDEPVGCEDNDYCSSVTFGSPAASTEEHSDFLSTIQVYPVPADTYLNIHFSELSEFEGVTWTIYSLDGKKVLNGTLKNQTSTILLPSSMVSGNYKLILTFDNKERLINFIKQ